MLLGVETRSIHRSSVRPALPSSRDAAANAIASSRSAAAPATSSAAPAFRSTTSRLGPCAPPSTARATRAASAGSPPRRSSGDARGIPCSVGSRRLWKTFPPRTSNTTDEPVVVSSSSPSSPRKSLARVPRRASTSAISGSIRSSETPTTCAVGRAGFVSGPRKLNEVGTRSSPRTGPACPNAGWKTGANMKPMPASARQRSTPVASRSIFTPSASRRSAEPQWLEAARLPCLATGTPAPATTIAATVEMLNVPLRSPPVPHVSSTGAGAETGFANSSAMRARPSSSSTVSPLVRNAIRNPPTCPGVTSPDMIARIASAASSVDSDSCDTSRCSVRGQRSASGSLMRAAR